LHPLLVYFALLFFFLVLSAFFSGSETAFTALSRLRLEYLADTGDKKAQYVKRLVSNPDKLLGVILLGNTIANVATASLVTYVATTYSPQNMAETVSLVASIILTLVILIFCELTPKIIAATHSEQLTRRLVWPIRLTIALLYPFARLAALIANGLVRITRLSRSTSPFINALSEDEIRAIIEGSTESGMAEEKRAMLHNVFEMGTTQVREVMIPRTEVTAVEIQDPISEILSVIRKTNFSRIPVYRESFDNVLGILYVKDLIQHVQRHGDISLRVLLRPAQFIPDTALLEAVLRQLQSMHLHMAVVVDEFGGVEGIVTLEDILEEIVGEIRDEHDVETESIRELGPNLYSVAGNLPVKDFNRVFHTRIPESREYATIVGFLQTRTGRLLKEGENIRYQELNFFIEKVDRFKIVSVRIRVPAPKEEEQAAG
jgi:putative hemolysin